MRDKIDINQIDPNPWQPRTSEDAEHIQNLAISIAKDGLLQPPAARHVAGDRYQLAFGHSRLAAYKWLLANGYGDDFASMPLEIVALTDEAMYRHAITENLQRKNLNTVEEARAMQRAMREFGYTSAKVGELFGKNEATVRGLVRLLELPEAALEKVASGEINQGTARKLMSVAGVVERERLVEVANDLARNPGMADYNVNWKIQQSIEKTKGIGKLPTNAFPSTWTHNQMPTAPEALKGWKGERKIKCSGMGQGWTEPVEESFRTAASLRANMGSSWEQIVIAHPEYADVVAHLRMLAEPPACNKCEHFLKFGDTHYCKLKACRDRKQAVWMEQKLRMMSETMGVAIYDPEIDPDTYQAWEHTWGGETRKQREGELKARPHELRLMLMDRPSYYEYDLTSDPQIAIVDISPAAQLAKAEAEQKQAESEARDAARRDNYDRAWKNHSRNRALLQERIVELFQVAFAKLDGINILALMAMMHIDEDDVHDLGKAERAAIIRKKAAFTALWNSLDQEEVQMDTPDFLKQLEGIARTWGVMLPDGWKEEVLAPAEAEAA